MRIMGRSCKVIVKVSTSNNKDKYLIENFVYNQIKISYQYTKHVVVIVEI